MTKVDKNAYAPQSSNTSIFENDAPSALRFTKVNIQAHLAQRTASPFTVMHMIAFLSTILVYRSRLALLPLPNKASEFLSSLDRTPQGFNCSGLAPSGSERHAEMASRAAQGIADLVDAYHPRNMLPVTPIVGFALYQATFLGVYALHFPYVNAHGARQSGYPGNLLASFADPVVMGHTALTALVGMRAVLPAANNWIRILSRLHRYYELAMLRVDGKPASLPSLADHNQAATNGHNTYHAHHESSRPNEAYINFAHTLRHLANLDVSTESQGFGLVAPHHPASSGPSSTWEHRSRGSLASSSDAGSADRTPNPASNNTSRPADSWTAINSAITSEHGTTRLGSASTQQLPPSTGGGQLPPIAPDAEHRSPLDKGSFASTSLPPLYQLAAAAEQNSRVQGPCMPVMAQEGGREPVASTVLFGGEDVALFIEGKTVEESDVLHGNGWLAKIWKTG